MKKKENEAAVVDETAKVENANGNMNVNVSADPNVVMPAQVPVEKPKGKFGDFLKKNKLIFIIAGAVILLLLIVILVYNLFFKDKYIEYPILYLENGQLVLWQKDSEEKIIVDDDYDDEENTSLIMTYANKTNNLFAYIDDGNLYLYNVKEGTNERIASDVSKYSLNFTDTDEYLIYESTEDTIYSYNIKEKMKNKVVTIDEDKGEAYIIVNYIVGNKVVYYVAEREDDSSSYDYKYTLHIKDLDNNNDVVITQNYDSSMINDDETEIVYVKEDDEDSMSLYRYDIKDNKSEKVLSGIYGVLSANDEYTEFVYYAKSDAKVEILDDDELGKDPVTSVTEQKVCSYSYYSSGYCTFDDWWYNRVVNITIVNSKKAVNDSIREAAEDLTYYDIYKFKDGKSEKLVSSVLDVYAANYENNTTVFEARNTTEKVKISTLKSLKDFNDYLEKTTEVYYQVGKDKPVSIGGVKDVNADDVVITKDKFIYVLNGENELLYVNAGKKEKKLQLLEEKVTSISNVEFDFGVAYSMVEDEDEDEFYDLYVVSGKEKKEVAKSVESVEFDEDEGKIYMMNECTENFCNYSSYDGKVNTLVTDVYDIKQIKDDEFYVFKNYSSKNKTYDLYRYSDGELMQIAFDVKVGYTSVHNIKTDN